MIALSILLATASQQMDHKAALKLLDKAIRYRDAGMAKKAFKAGARVYERDERDMRYFVKAIQRSPSVTEAFIENGARVNDHFWPKELTPLHYAVSWSMTDAIGPDGRSSDVIRRLLKHGALIDAFDEDGKTPLMYAAGHRHFRGQVVLVENGADVNATDKWGRTPLTYSAMRGSKDRGVHNLLKAGAKVGFTEALLLHQWNIAKELLRDGHRLDISGPSNSTPLMIAAEHGQLDIVRALYEKGFSVNMRDDGGNTALMLAAAGTTLNVLPGPGWTFDHETSNEVARLATVQFLLDCGADVNVPSWEGVWGIRESALDLARARGYKKIEALLIAHGAREAE